LLQRSVKSIPIAQRLPNEPLRFRLVVGLFFLSGASSLILETVFNRLLTYTFGNTAAAVSTVLAAFLGGLALGSWLFGLWADRRKPSLRMYGALEAAIAIYALLIPRVFAAVTTLYVHVCQQFDFGPASITLLRFAMAAAAILPASFLMGGTLPVLSGYIANRNLDFQRGVDRLYAWNTLGAALGALVSTYGLIPSLGIPATIYGACGANLLIFVCALVLSTGETDADPVLGTARFPESTAATSTVHPRLPPMLLLLGAFLTGAAALGYEVIWAHVQAFTIGNTVYAFGVTLFAVLCGLGLGAQVSAEKLRDPKTWAAGLVSSQFLLGLSVFATLPLWGSLSKVFSRSFLGVMRVDTFAVAVFIYLGIGYAYSRISRKQPDGTARKVNPARTALVSVGVLLAVALAFSMKYGDEIVFDAVAGRHLTVLFVASELMRFVCAFSLLIVPALLVGITFPLLINLYSGFAGRAASKVGFVYAANTFGAIFGSLLTGFFLIPKFGSQGTLKAIASSNVLLALFFACLLISARARARAAWAMGGATLVVLCWLGVPHWDPKAVCNGAYVYFAPGFDADRVLYQKEDAAGGMTSVVQVGKLRTLLSNGKFQGNNSTEVGAQVRFALLPMLFVHQPRNGLVIGLGTGQTLHTLSLFPFREIDVAEMAPQIVEASRIWFADVNGGVVDHDPRVRIHIADGRNFLLLTRRQYDAITIEVSSIWIDGEADLYNREFYELCRKHLSQGGVLQQWVQLHHMPLRNLLVILNTAARTFPHVAFFVGQSQGVLLASNQPLRADYNELREWDRDPRLRQAMDSIQVPVAESLLGDLTLYDDSLRNAVTALPDVGHLPADFVSSDFRPFLEYESPKGNVYPLSSFADNLQWLNRLRPETLPQDLVLSNVPSQDEWNLILGYALAERNQRRLALDYFDRVNGPARPQAQQEIARLESSSTLVNSRE
jgi:spermidine synthase